MKAFRLIVTFPAGTVLIGGYSPVQAGLDQAHASDAQGRPLLPSTALRGALRETLEALLRGDSQPCCAGGTGRTPEESEAGAEPIPCTMAAGGRCLACRLFGTRRAAVDRAETSFSSLTLGDASIVGAPPAWGARHSVAISRPERSAREGHLLTAQVPMIPREQPMVATGGNRDAALEPLLEAAVRATTHIGSARSRGYARADLVLEWVEADSVLSPVVPALRLPPEGDVGLRVTLLAPAALGVPAPGENLRPSRTEISGATLRGAIGFALARQLDDPDGNEALQRLVAAETGAHFGFLYPASSAGAALTGPWPLTARACKNAPGEHGVVDTLLDRIAATLADGPGAARAVAATSRMECRVCRAPLRNAPGTRDRMQGLATRMVTRLALERTRTSARSGALFSTELVEPGAVFAGSIRKIPSGTRELLAQGLGSELFLGRGSSAGWGRVSVKVIQSPRREALADRAAAFQEALDRRLRDASISGTPTGCLVPVTLLAPLWPEEGDEDGERSLLSAVGAPAGVLLRARRFSHEGGWDQRKGTIDSTLALAAGGAFVLELERPIAESLSILESLEASGAGQRRHQGYGHVICFDPFIHRGEES